MNTVERIIHRVLWKGHAHDLILDRDRVVELRPAQETSGEQGEFMPLLLPGLMDCHTHLREPGQEHKEDVVSGSQAAAAGGFGNILCMPNTSPPNDHPGITSHMLGQALLRHSAGPALHPVGALSKQLEGKELSPMFELAQAGCIAFSNDGLPVSDTAILRQAMEYSADLKRVVIDHCEDPTLSPEGVINEGQLSSRLGLPGVPSIAESIQVARDILLSSYLDIPIHLAHISTRESVELIHWAKAKGIPVSAETCPHYLTWSENQILEYNPLFKVNPPLRSTDDILALRQAIRDGTIDILATDHAPHADHEKEMPYSDAPSGISGLDTALSLCWSLVQQNELSTQDLLRLWCHRPAELFGLRENQFHPGDPADFLLFDPSAIWTPTPENLLSKGKNTPCLHQELPGRVLLNCFRGEVIFGEVPEDAFWQ